MVYYALRPQWGPCLTDSSLKCPENLSIYSRQWHKTSHSFASSLPHWATKTERNSSSSSSHTPSHSLASRSVTGQLKTERNYSSLLPPSHALVSPLTHWPTKNRTKFFLVLAHSLSLSRLPTHSLTHQKQNEILPRPCSLPLTLSSPHSLTHSLTHQKQNEILPRPCSLPLTLSSPHSLTDPPKTERNFSSSSSRSPWLTVLLMSEHGVIEPIGRVQTNEKHRENQPCQELHGIEQSCLARPGALATSRLPPSLLLRLNLRTNIHTLTVREKSGNIYSTSFSLARVCHYGHVTRWKSR